MPMFGSEALYLSVYEAHQKLTKGRDKLEDLFARWFIFVKILKG